MVTVNDTTIEYTPGMTVADALCRAGVPGGFRITVVDGAVLQEWKTARTEIEDGARLRSFPLSSGG